MNDDNKVIYLKRETPPKLDVLSDVFRVGLGFLVVIGSLFGAYGCEESKASERHVRFNQCIETGKKPLLCSFEVAFQE